MAAALDTPSATTDTKTAPGMTGDVAPDAEVPAGALAMPEYYDAEQYWPTESLSRMRELKAKMAQMAQTAHKTS